MKTRILPLAVVAALLATTGVASAETRKFSGKLQGSPGGKVTFTFTFKRDKDKKVIRKSKKVSKVRVTGLRSECGTTVSHRYKGRYGFQGPVFLGNSFTDEGSWNASASINRKATKATGSVGFLKPGCNANARFTAKAK
ncbi:MAG TPA: hypothetical protein VEX39_05990 [Thermoleophilaceae bacterium]|nr:hypothetical protein [Thermoleophilaceae bacterium]